MKRFISCLAAAVAIGVLVTLSATAATRRTDIQKERPKAALLARYVSDFYGGLTAQQEALYVGSEMCLACHSGPGAIHGFDTSGWRDTFHARPFKAVPDATNSMVVGKGIVADANQNGIDDFIDGLDFNDPSMTVFEAYKPNAPILGYSDETGYTVTIGEVSLRVLMAWGGNGFYKQRFVTRIPVTDRANGLSGGTYILPVQYNEKTHQYVPYHPENWYGDDNLPIFTAGADSALAAARGRNFDSHCSGCHFTGTTIRQDSFGEWVASAAPTVLLDPDDPTYIDYNGDGIKEMTQIGCESCHGPGSRHVIGHGDPSQIVKPEDDFTTAQANQACGACHVRGGSSDGTFGFPWDEANDHGYVNGQELSQFFTPGQGLWPDGKTSKKHHQQYQDFIQSSKPTFPFHQVKCSECHDLHVATEHNIRQFIDEEGAAPDEIVRIPTENDNNTLCLACHATHEHFEQITKEMVADYEANRDFIAETVSEHSHHPYAPERKLGLSRCSKCHMPKVAKSAINYDIHSHTFEAIPPQKTLLFQEQGGMPSSCAVSCHRNIIDIFPNSFDSQIGTWSEASDVALAEWLMTYYGPDGAWWMLDLEGGEDDQ